MRTVHYPMLKLHGDMVQIQVRSGGDCARVLTSLVESLGVSIVALLFVYVALDAVVAVVASSCESHDAGALGVPCIESFKSRSRLGSANSRPSSSSLSTPLPSPELATLSGMKSGQMAPTAKMVALVTGWTGVLLATREAMLAHA